MKLIIFIGFFSICGLCSLQAQDYELVDATIQLYPKRFNTPEEFSKFLTRDFHTEEEKVRGIYTWLIQNVSYDPDEYKNFQYSFTNYRERNQKEEKARKKIIDRTLQKGVAVCEGYAMVFERMCELQGISNYLVRGDIKTNFQDIGRSFATSHMWNVAVIDGKPYLFDPTWGAGRYTTAFIKEPTYFFYKIEPSQLFKTHYPVMYEDTFLSEQVSRQEFSNRPLVISREMTFDDLSAPTSGWIDTTQYFDEILFEIRNVAPKSVSYSYQTDQIEVQVSREEGVLKFGVPIELGQRTLLIYFDGKPALGYKLK